MHYGFIIRSFIQFDKIFHIFMNDFLDSVSIAIIEEARRQGFYFMHQCDASTDGGGHTRIRGIRAIPFPQQVGRASNDDAWL